MQASSTPNTLYSKRYNHSIFDWHVAWRVLEHIKAGKDEGIKFERSMSAQRVAEGGFLKRDRSICRAARETALSLCGLSSISVDGRVYVPSSVERTC